MLTFFVYNAGRATYIERLLLSLVEKIKGLRMEKRDPEAFTDAGYPNSISFRNRRAATLPYILLLR